VSILPTVTGESPGRAAPVSARIVAVAVTGLAVGALTSVLQKYLNSPWLSLVNSASPWLTPMFFLGALWRRPAAAALAGLAIGLLELAGYYLTAEARGFAAGHVIVVFWAVCAVIGGPVFGLAGWAWRWAAGRWQGLGAAALPAAYVAEALVGYGLRLGYWPEAILFGVLAAAMAALLGARGWQYMRLLTGFLVAFPAGVLAELLLGLIYSQSF
jgi:Family of unknown function (DUF6518)